MTVCAWCDSEIRPRVAPKRANPTGWTRLEAGTPAPGPASHGLCRSCRDARLSALPTGPVTPALAAAGR